MNYDQVLNTMQSLVNKYIGRDLYFGTGTFNELNADDNRNYPLVWLNQPLNKTISIAPNNTIISTWNIQLQFLQSESLTTKRDTADSIYNTLEKIAMGFIGRIVIDFDTDGVENILVTSMNQVYKKQDSVHIGWQINLSIQTPYDLDNCCSLFAD